MRDKLLKNIKRVVIKIGTSTIATESGVIDKTMARKIAAEIKLLVSSGVHVVLVSSGAIAFGMQVLNIKQRPKAVSILQACAAVGQHKLMALYDEIFGALDMHIAQILLTREDLHARNRYLNAQKTILHLLDNNVLPIINENDTVATEEIKFGDNDNLSALVANLVEADMLIILSDVDGLYDQKTVVPYVLEITQEIIKLAGGTNKHTSLGGMRTKLEAAKIVTNSGVLMVIANGKAHNIIKKIFDGEEIGTLFVPKDIKMEARKRWIAYSARSKGKIFIDEGAYIAIAQKGKSLLSSGIIDAQGDFKAGDMVNIYTVDKKEVGRGIINYSREQIIKVKGKNTKEIPCILGTKKGDEIIHRDDMVVLKTK